jgi:hypothetical protein
MNVSDPQRLMLNCETDRGRIHRDMRICHDAFRPTRTRRRRFATRPAFAATILFLAACGSDADLGPTAAPTEVSSVDDAQQDAPAVADATAVHSAADVANCLAAAGYPTTLSSELLTEQQSKDLESVFGRIDGLTFADVSAFGGEIGFFTTPEQAAARADQLRDTSKELRLSGSALIHVSAGIGYEAHVDAATECLT